MLVLSRKVDQKIVFPGLNIGIEVVDIKGSSVRLGIDAPRQIEILRGELLKSSEKLGSVSAETDIHALKNKLNAANLLIRLAQRQLELGHHEKAVCTLSDASGEFQVANRLLERKAVNRRVALLAEDDHNERELLAGYLRTYGYRVVTTSNGQETLDYLADAELPDVVLLDVAMPVRDGIDTLNVIRSQERTKDLRVWAVSAKRPPLKSDSVAHRAVFDEWFEKPLDVSRLAAQMAAAVS